MNIDGDQYSSLGVERKIDNRAARSMELGAAWAPLRCSLQAACEERSNYHMEANKKTLPV